MKKMIVTLVTALVLSVGMGAIAAQQDKTKESKQEKKHVPKDVNHVTADQALEGVPMLMTPNQLPHQFSTMIRDDASRTSGVAILKQNGSDIDYTFAYWDVTSPVTQAHFHYGPHNQVAARAFSICGVKGESPDCPSGTRASISGVWKNADINAVKSGDIVIAFHTQKYAPPAGEFAVYVPAKGESAK